MDEEPAQVGVTSLADAEQLQFAARRVLAWYKAEPSREIAGTREGVAVISAPNAPGLDPYARKIAAFAPINSEGDDPVGKIVRDQSPYTRMYDPSNVIADVHGYAVLPNVNAIVETTNLQMAIQLYETNLGAAASIDAAAQATIDLLK